MTDTEIRYPASTIADFLDLLAEDIAIPRAAKAHGISPEHASLPARAHGWPDRDVMSRTADKLREPAPKTLAEKVVESIKTIEQRPAVKHAPASVLASSIPERPAKPLQGLSAELDALLDHPDWRVAASARLIRDDLRTLRRHHRRWEASQKESAA